MDDHFLGSFLVIWWFLRAIRCALPRIQYAPTALMCASASVLNPAAFLAQDEHQKQYQKFMEKMCIGVTRSTLLIPQAVIKKPSLHGWDKFVYCDELHRDTGGHPTSSCTHSVLFYVLPKIFWISLKMYGPLYLAWNVFKVC